MTTPERLRRRQHLLGYLVAVMGLALIGQAVYFNDADGRQRECIAQNFSDLTTALEVRAGLTTRDTAISDREQVVDNKETAATAGILDTYARVAALLQGDPEKELTPEQQEQFNREIIAALLNYRQVATETQVEREEIRKDRAALEQIRVDTPIPPFPSGTCDSGTKEGGDKS